MATNLALNDKLIEEAVKLGQHASKKDAVNAALADYVRRKKQLELLSSFGKIEFWAGFDPKKLRRKSRR